MKRLKRVKEDQRIVVYGTQEGKVFIKPEELFALEKVKDVILRARKLNILKNAKAA